MKGLDPGLCRILKGDAQTLEAATDATITVYAPTLTRLSCDNVDTDCHKYTLVYLEAGGTYSKNS